MGWVRRFADALLSESESSHNLVVASLMSNGVTREELYDFYVPATARHIGELWVQDRINFVDVTTASARLQALFRSRPSGDDRKIDRSIPLGQSVLMAIPSFEDHSLGAFVAADRLRRHGLWVHVAIAPQHDELVELIDTGRFAMVGLSVATPNTVEKLTDVVDYLRSKSDELPPIVVGGRAVTDRDLIVRRTGADLAVKSAREAVERCGLATVATTIAAEL